jgi:hypothetical protein
MLQSVLAVLLKTKEKDLHTSYTDVTRSILGYNFFTLTILCNFLLHYFPLHIASTETSPFPHVNMDKV